MNKKLKLNLADKSQIAPTFKGFFVQGDRCFIETTPVWDETEEAEIVIWKGGEFANFHEWHEPTGPYDDGHSDSTTPIKNVSEVIECIQEYIDDDNILANFQRFIFEDSETDWCYYPYL